MVVDTHQQNKVIEKLKQKGLNLEKNYGKQRKKVTQPMITFGHLLVDQDSHNNFHEPQKKRARTVTKPEIDDSKEMNDSDESENEIYLNRHKHVNRIYSDDEEFEFK